MLSPSLKHFHDAVYVVTAPGFDERQENCKRELGQGNFEFVYGLNAATTSKVELTASGEYDEAAAIKLDRRGKNMTLGHICCSIAHANAYRHIIENKIDRALIFEDDVFCLPLNENVVQQAVSAVPNDAELIYWGWAGGGYRPWYGAFKQAMYHVQHSLGLLKYDHTMIENLYSRPFNEHFDIAGKHFLGHSYSVTRFAAEKLLRLNTPIVFNADNALMIGVLSGEVKAYISRTQFFGQGSFDASNPVESLTKPSEIELDS